jgi:hypothetical protein
MFEKAQGNAGGHERYSGGLSDGKCIVMLIKDSSN